MNDKERLKIQTALEIFDQTPHFIWWKDKHLRYTLINHQTAKMMGYSNSKISFESITDHMVPCKSSELANEFELQDKLVMRTQKQLTGIAFCNYGDNGWRITMGHKFPRFDRKTGDVIGMSGTAVDITDCAVMRTALILVADDDRFIGRKINALEQFTYMLKETYDDFNLSERESECLFLLLRGKTAREIADILFISNRTVEKHTDNIKSKMGCFTKSELIDKALSFGAGSIIPKSLINPAYKKIDPFVESS